MDSYDLAKKGEIVSTKSALALDEEIYCRRCGHIFVLADGTFETAHPKLKGVRVMGMQCPNCKIVNITYVKTPKLMSLEKRLDNAPIDKREKIRAKYQREFTRVQKKYGGVKPEDVTI